MSSRKGWETFFDVLDAMVRTQHDAGNAVFAELALARAEDTDNPKETLTRALVEAANFAVWAVGSLIRERTASPDAPISPEEQIAEIRRLRALSGKERLSAEYWRPRSEEEAGTKEILDDEA